MVILCDEIQNEKLEYYENCCKKISDIVTWYQTIYERFQIELKQESLETQKQNYQAEYEILAKEKLFNIIEPLIKLTLSKFSYGPANEFFVANDFVMPGTKTLNKICKCSWLDVQLKFAELIEILAHMLKKNNCIFSFDLKVLAADRDQRNELDHQGARIQCLTLIRKYNSIRNMLVFLDSDNEVLPSFQENDDFDYERFIAKPCDFSFKETINILIVDSVHDISRGYLGTVANLPWDIVVDFDGYSDCGGLLSSVSHNSIRKELLFADKSFNIFKLDRLQTLWCRCGEYLLPEYHSPESIDVIGAQRFKDNINNKYYTKAVTDAIKNVLNLAIDMQYFVNIVVLSDDIRIVKGSISALRDKEFENYYLTWAGAARSNIENDFAENEGEDFCNEHFYHHQCPIHSFFSTFFNHKTSWESRNSNNLEYALPIGSGNYVTIPENIRNNLSPYFEVLYKDWDSIIYHHDENFDTFLKGGQATWQDIASGKALFLDSQKEAKLIDLIKTNTGRAQEESPQKNLFFIEHKAGIGGTTFVKQIAWKLHNDMVVLEVKQYDEQRTFEHLKDLYDNRIDKNPMLLVAEDTLPNLEALCDAFLINMRNRRCALLIACREHNGICANYPKSIKETFKQLQDNAITALKFQYKEISPLSKTELQEKSNNFNKDVSNDIRTPFIIGLYFLEKEFHIETYVKKVLESPLLPVYKEMIAILALCDMYDNKELPSSFVNNVLGYNMRERNSLIRSCPGAASLICLGKNASGLEVYYFKHKLLSNQYFEMYTNNAASSGRFELTKKLIEYASKCQGASENDFVINTLLNILIRNKDEETNNISQLLTDIAIPENQRDLIEYLAETFRPTAEKILQNMKNNEISQHETGRNINVLRLVSHAYAHLGKLYITPENYEKALQYFSLAEQYMQVGDPFIYHMHGKVLHKQLLNEWNKNTECNDGTMNKYEDMVKNALELFVRTCDFGGIEYGLTGQLELLYDYLKFIYKINNILKKEDIKKLTPKQLSYQIMFIDVLNEAKQYDELDETAIKIIEHKEKLFQAEVIMGNFGKTIEYYNNEYMNYTNRGDTENALLALQVLVSVKIQKTREEYCSNNSKKMSFYSLLPNSKNLFEQIEILLPTLYNKKDYRSYSKRTALFRHWFQLAKLLNCSINSAKIKIRYWVESENARKGKKNPEPYYYQAMLAYLEILEGGKNESELHTVLNNLNQMNRMDQFDTKCGRINKIKDILVEGTGMGRIMDISDCSSMDDIITRINNNKKKPVALSGNVQKVEYWGAEISISSPVELLRQKIISEVGRLSKNTLSIQQENHKVKFLAGFTVRGMRAIGDSVRDQDSRETFELCKILVEQAKK